MQIQLMFESKLLYTLFSGKVNDRQARAKFEQEGHVQQYYGDY